jgi:hypothetical protein
MEKFAGFNWPKRPWTLPRGNVEQRAKALIKPKAWRNLYVNPLYMSFDWEKSDIPDLEWSYCDAVLAMHKRAYRADDWSGLEFRGIVLVLPNRRGFLGGYTDGVWARVDYDIFQDQRDAAICADDMALTACEREVEYQARLAFEEEEERRLEQEEREEDETQEL